jgi:5'(3')-deoxyribonucleotidase
VQDELIVFCDLDEVLCNFADAAITIHGIDPVTVHSIRRERNIWDCASIIGELKGDPNFGCEDFWKPIHAYERFWEELDAFDHTGAMINYLREYHPNFKIVTSPANNPRCLMGKMLWCRMWLRLDVEQVIFTPHKEMLARPGRILLDDRAGNVDRFKALGGGGIVFPARGNQYEDYLSNVVDYIHEKIGEYNYVF